MARLLPLQDQLPEIVELGLRQMEAEADAKTKGKRSVSRQRVLEALRSTGIVTLPDASTHQVRVRHTPIQSGGQPASEMIIEERRKQL